MPSTTISNSIHCLVTSLGFPLEKGKCYNTAWDQSPKMLSGNPKKPVINPNKPVINPNPPAGNPVPSAKPPLLAEECSPLSS